MLHKRSYQVAFTIAALLLITVPAWADSFIMTSPSANNVLSYSDETLVIRFAMRKDMTEMSLTPEYTGITFTLTNKTDHAITVNWMQSSMIVPTGLTSSVIHEGTRFITARETQAPTVVPPGSTLEDSVVPTNNITSTSSGWSLERLGLVTGSQFGLYLDTEIGGIHHDYDFRFRALQIAPTGGRSALAWIMWITLGILVGITAVTYIIYASAMY